MQKYRIDAWSPKTKGIKLNGKFYDCTDAVLKEAIRLGVDCEVEVTFSEENQKLVTWISGQANHEVAVKQEEERKFISASEQIRESALKSAVASLDPAGNLTASIILQRAEIFERYIRSGSASAGID